MTRGVRLQTRLSSDGVRRVEIEAATKFSKIRWSAIEERAGLLHEWKKSVSTNLFSEYFILIFWLLVKTKNFVLNDNLFAMITFTSAYTHRQSHRQSHRHARKMVGEYAQLSVTRSFYWWRQTCPGGVHHLLFSPSLISLNSPSLIVIKVCAEWPVPSNLFFTFKNKWREVQADKGRAE